MKKRAYRKGGTIEESATVNYTSEGNYISLNKVIFPSGDEYGLKSGIPVLLYRLNRRNLYVIKEFIKGTEIEKVVKPIKETQHFITCLAMNSDNSSMGIEYLTPDRLKSAREANQQEEDKWKQIEENYKREQKWKESMIEQAGLT